MTIAHSIYDNAQSVREAFLMAERQFKSAYRTPAFSHFVFFDFSELVFTMSKEKPIAFGVMKRG